jgi:hypothetical protein
MIDRAETQGASSRFRVLDVVPFEEEDVGMPLVEAALAVLMRRSICQDVGRGSRRNVERDALTGKGDLSKRISPSMTQPAPQASSYIVVSLST